MWSCMLALSLKPRYSNQDTLLVRQRLPVLKATYSSAKKFDAKSFVASELLQKLFQIHDKFPALFKKKKFSRTSLSEINGKEKEEERKY